MNATAFARRLDTAWRRSGSLVCVGLDPSREKLPGRFAGSSTPLLDFCRAIVDATHDLVCAYKPQFAYFAAAGAEAQLAALIAHIRARCPDVPVILDAKRGDIGSTAEMYAAEAFDRYGADAVTVNPYMGGDTLAPFLARHGRGVVVLCRTSNPGAAEFQGLVCDGEPLYMRVARKAAGEWNRAGNVALVVGATAPEELAAVRRACPDLTLLVPGVGAQGGDVDAVVRSGIRADGYGLVINSSRAIIHAASDNTFAEAARAAAIELRDRINRARKKK